MAWVYAIVFIVALVVAYTMMPKPETRPPAGLDEIQAPTADTQQTAYRPDRLPS